MSEKDYLELSEMTSSSLESSGFQMIEDTRSEIDLVRDGFRKVDFDAVRDNSVVVRYAYNQIGREVLRKQFRGALVLTNGNINDLADTGDGLFYGFMKDDITQRINAQGRFKMVNPSEKGEFLDVMDGVFSILAFATAEFFKAQINEKLKDILTGIQEVSQFLEDDKLCELQAAYDELKEIYDHILFIKDNTNRATLNMERVRQIMHIARKDMLFFEKQVTNIQNNVANKDKRDTARENVSKIVMALSRYRLALAVFSETKLIEIYLSKVSNPEELSIYKDEIQKCIDLFVTNYKRTRDWCRRYYMTHNLAEEADKIPFIDEIDAFINNNIKQETQASKGRLSGKTAERLTLLQVNPDDLYIPVKSLSSFIDVVQRGLELVYLDGNLYTNIPV